MIIKKDTAMNDAQEMKLGELEDIHVTDGEKKLLNYLEGKSGPFNKALFETIFHADCLNLRRLSQVFGEEVAAFESYKSQPDFFLELKARLEEQK